MPLVDNFISDLKDAIREAKLAPTGKGTMVMLYGACLLPESRAPGPARSGPAELTRPRVFAGLGESSPVGPTMVGHVAEAFLDALYKA